MKLSEFQLHLQRRPDDELRFAFPDGGMIEAHAHITEVKAGHLSMISQPDAVTKVILEAAQSVSG